MFLLRPGVASAGIAPSACVLVTLVANLVTKSGIWRYSDYTTDSDGFYLNNALVAESYSISLVQAGNAKTARMKHTDNGATFADYAHEAKEHTILVLVTRCCFVPATADVLCVMSNAKTRRSGKLGMEKHICRLLQH